MRRKFPTAKPIDHGPEFLITFSMLHGYFSRPLRTLILVHVPPIFDIARDFQIEITISFSHKLCP